MIATIGLLVLVTAYILSVTLYLVKVKDEKDAVQGMMEEKTMMFLPWETYLMQRIDIKDKYIKPIFWTSRILLAIIAFLAFRQMGYMILFFITAIVGIMIGSAKEKELMVKSGLEFIETVNRFLDMYIPTISSGSSNDQAMLKFISERGDEDLSAWYLNKDNPEYEIPLKWNKVIEVYNIVRFDEEKGIADSLSVIKEMQDDMAAKQRYFNDYKAKIGEIKPTTLSYYFGVPFFLIISLTQVKDFWNGLGGFICSLILVILFIAFQFFIYKIKKSTMESIF